MAGDTNTVIARIGLDDRGFQEGVSKIQRSLKVVQSEFAAASAGLGDFGKSTEGLKLKANSLNRQVDIQAQKVRELEHAYQASVRAKGEDAKATENLKIKVNYATAELNKMQQELQETTRELNLKSSAWYKLSQNMDAAGKKMKVFGDKLSSVGKTLSTAVTLPILGIATASTKLAMDAVESENLFEVAMGDMADSARKWSDETSKALGLNAYSVRKNVATYNAMLTSMGLSDDESLKLSETLTQLSYDMASFYNLSPDEAFNKLKSGISGEAEPLKALGILVNENTVKSYAYANGIAKQGEALTEAQKVQARFGVIMESTKNAQGDLARTLDSPTNKLRIMQEQATQLGIQFGQILIPVLEKIISVVKPLMDAFQGLSKEQQEQIVKIALVAAAAGPVIGIVGKIISVIGGISTAVGAISGALASVGGISGALGAVFTALTGPIGLVIAIIAGLIAVGILLYTNWDTIKQKTTEVWNSIKSGVEGPMNSVKNTIRTALDAIVGFFRNLKLPEIKIPKPKLPHFEISGSFSLNPPKAPKLGIKWYASGGIFNSPSVIGVGEEGSEAVVPIDRLENLIISAMQKVSLGKNGQLSGGPSGVTNTYNITVNNPKPESSEDSIRRTLLKHSYGVV